jgi:hypothetical protein
MRLYEFKPPITPPPAPATVSNSHHDAPVATTAKDIVKTTARTEVKKEATIRAVEHIVEALAEDIARLLPRFENSLTPGVGQVVALALTAKNLYKQQWTAATAAAISAVPYPPTAIAAIAVEMAAELYGEYYVKEHSHKPADPTIDSVQDPVGTDQRMKFLVSEITKALKVFCAQGLERVKQGMDPNSPNSLARVTARNAPRSAGPILK